MPTRALTTFSTKLRFWQSRGSYSDHWVTIRKNPEVSVDTVYLYLLKCDEERNSKNLLPQNTQSLGFEIIFDQPTAAEALMERSVDVQVLSQLNFPTNDDDDE